MFMSREILHTTAVLWLATLSASPGPARANDAPPCNPETLRSEQMFNCGMPEGLAPLLEPGPAQTYKNKKARAAFPSRWHQFGFDQPHNPVFSVTDGPEFLREGTFWAAPLTGDAYLRLAPALKYFPQDGGQSWTVSVNQSLGNVVGVSVAQGIVYAGLSREAVWAMDAATGRPIWKAEVVNNAGMGQPVVAEIGGRPVVFVASGDSLFTLDNTIEFANGKPHDRGGNFSAVYAFDGVTGEKKWEFHTRGASRPTPLYLDGVLHVASGDGLLYLLDARSGKLISRFTNPGEGYSGLASPNLYRAPDGRRLLIYGTTRPRNIVGVDVTDARAPTLAWVYTPPGAVSNAAGDISVAVDPKSGAVLTNVFTRTAQAGVFDNIVYTLDAASGALRWSASAGTGPNIPGFKGGNPMIHDGVAYLGNPLNETYRAYDLAHGGLLWATSLEEPDDAPQQRHRASAAGVYYQGKIIHSEGRDIRTFDAETGAILNHFETPGSFAVWGLAQPVVVGNMIYLGSVSGWIFAAPLDYVMTSPGFGERPFPPPHPLPPQQPEYYDPGARPTTAQAAQFPDTWLAYAGGPTHNSVVAKGPRGIQWRTPLNHALPLEAPAYDQALFGPEIAGHMTQLAFGAGVGVAPVNGILHTGSDRYTVNALNATTGQLIWRYQSISANFGQPLVTPQTVVISGGDPWFALRDTENFAQANPATELGGRFGTLIGLDPATGVEKWTFYSGNGTSGMTPLYHKNRLHWINGDGRVWAVDADTGTPAAPFMGADGRPVLDVGGFNAVSSTNIYYQPDKRPAIMIAGKALPHEILGIDLDNATVRWRQSLAPYAVYRTGFSAVPPAVDQNRGLVVGTVFVNPAEEDRQATLLAYALDAASGAVAWTRELGRGRVPYGYVGPTPMIDDNRVFLVDPIWNKMVALDLRTGDTSWETPFDAVEGRPSFGPGVVTGGRLIQALGDELQTFDARTGRLVARVRIGGAFIYQHPTVVGDTLYIGNSWGWALALPVSEITGGR